MKLAIIITAIYLFYLFCKGLCDEIFKEQEDSEEFECTLEPYCKCEDCQNYEGGLPIDRL